MGDNRNHGWTDERVATLKRLWVDDGLTGSQIARQLGGVTRSAVIGKVHRLGLSGHRSPEVVRANYERGFQALQAGQRAWREANPPLLRPAVAAKEPHPWAAKAKAAPKAPAPAKPVQRPALTVVGGTAAPKPAPAPVIAPDQPEPRHLTMMQLGTGVCRWPIGEGEAMTFCGCATPDVTDPKQPYCAFHRRKAFQPGKPKALTAVTRPSMGGRRVTRSEMFREAAEIRREAATPEQVALRLGVPLMNVRPRCSELARLGLIEDSRVRRLAMGGRKAIVWKAVVR